MAVPLASAFVRLRPRADDAEFRKAGRQAGTAAGEEISKGVGKGVSDGARGGGATKAGQDAGKSFADGFYRDSTGRLRQANGRFATDAQKAMLEGGRKSGQGFGKNFSDTGGGVIRNGFNKLKGELGPLLVPLGIGAAVAAIGQIGMTYEDNLNIFKSVTKATGDQMAIVAEKARLLGADVELPGVSAAGAAAAMTELSKAGFSVQQSMDAARGTLQLARVANISEADAAEIAANAVNAFGINAKDTSFVVDQLAAAANSSSIEVTEASHSFKMAAAVFSGVQGEAVGSKEAITELNTAVAILGNNGIKGSDAGTSLKQMLLQLTGPTQGAKDQMKLLAEIAAGANITLDQQNQVLHGSKKARQEALAEIKKANPEMKAQGDIAYDASGKMRGLREIIGLVAAGTKGMTQEERNFAVTQIFGADASRAVLALLKGGLPVYDKQRKAVLATGAAADFAAAKNAGLKGAFDNLKSQFENMAISIYNVIKGPVTAAVSGLANFLAPVAGHITTLARVIGENIGVIRDWALALGAVYLALRLNSLMLSVTAAGGLVKYIKGIRVVSATTRLWAGAQAFLNASLLANPIGLVIIALTALVAGVVLAYRHSETFRKIVSAAWGGIKAAVSATVDFLVTKVWPVIKMIWDGIAAGALWLWRNAIKPAWDGISAAVAVAVRLVRTAIQAGIVVFNTIAGVVRWLYNNIFAPVFRGIAKVVEIFWFSVRIIFAAFKGFLENVIFPVVTFLYQNLFLPVFKAITKVVEIFWFSVKIIFTAFYKVGYFIIKTALDAARIAFTTIFNFIAAKVQQWWAEIKIVFGLFKAYVIGPLVAIVTAVKNLFVKVFNQVKDAIVGWYNTTIKPYFDKVSNAWSAVSNAFSKVYNNNIKPLFQKFIGFIKDNVAKSFSTAVETIRAAWDKVKEYAKKPIKFVVDHVINPFIGGLNKAAGIVGIKDRIEPVVLHDGGTVPPARALGYRQGGRIAGTPGLTDNRQAMVSGLGPVQLNGGEYIVNAKDTRKALPLLQWVNRGMKGGISNVRRLLGRPLTDKPGDGSEGWAFKDGGVVGWTNDVWAALSNPVETIKKPFLAALNLIPGLGNLRDIVIGASKTLVSGVINWLKIAVGMGAGSLGAGHYAPGRVGAAQAFVAAQRGKPYVWASAGPGGYDCSGIVSAVYNILRGTPIHQHTFSTAGLPGQFFDQGATGPLMAGWSHPGQAPASRSTGHMAGQIAGFPFESRGSRGVVTGASARGIREFANVGAARLHGGGPVTPALFDGGGRWSSGVLGLNASGHTEHVMTGGPDGDMDRMIALLRSIDARLGGVGGDVADALKAGTRAGVQRGRAMGRVGTA